MSLSKFSERISELMQEHEILSEQLSEKIGVCGSAIRRWCNGDTNIHLSNMLRVATYFNCSLDFLAGRTDKPLDFIPKPCPVFYIHFRSVLKKYNITTYNLRKNTKINGLHFDRWKNGADPKLSSLLEIANYLNITLDYLAGRECD